MQVLQGKSIFTGYVCLKALSIRHDRPVFSHEKCKNDEECKAELASFRNACAEVVATLHQLMDKAGGDEEVSILEAQSFMVQDPEFHREIAHLISCGHYKAAPAVEIAAQNFINVLSSAGSSVSRENVSDIQDIAVRIISSLTKESLLRVRLEEKSVLVADTILPSELMSLNKEYIAAICLDGGGQTSHVAILARAMNIPCIMGLKDASSLVKTGSLVALDAYTGTLYIDPDDETVKRINALHERSLAEEKELSEDAVLPAITKDGRRIYLECNIEGLDFVQPSLRNGAEGVGLFRTEFLLMEEGKTYSEDEQTAVYSRLARRFRSRGPVTIRTYDMGGDKIIKDMKSDEDNPVLGWRAVRFCMSEKEIFRTQLRAILRSSTSGRLQIMFPMISGSDELDSVLDYFEEVKEECRKEGIAFDEDMKVGTMIEVPSAAITSDILARKVDFFSVGTNDLTQYTIAVDRGNEKISYLYKEYHIALLRLLRLTAENAHKEGIGLSICGEMAGNPFYIPLVIGLGYDTLSMNPASLLNARKLIRSINYSDCLTLAKEAGNMTSCRDIEKLLEKFHAEIGDTE